MRLINNLIDKESLSFIIALVIIISVVFVWVLIFALFEKAGVI